MTIELVVGLGNPGEEYEATRHNAGFRVVDEVARRLRAGAWRRRFLSDVAATRRGRRIWLAKPRTYMNRSGAAVAELCSGLDVPVSATLIVVDDVDLPIGQIRLRPSGGPGTHNGLRDIVAYTGPGFPRLRVGVGPSAPVDDLAEYVLSPFCEDELDLANDMIELAAEAVIVGVFDGLGRAMNRFNQRTLSHQPKE